MQIEQRGPALSDEARAFEVELRRFLARMEAAPEGLESFRALAHELYAAAGARVPGTLEPASLGGVDALWFHPDAATGDVTLLYLHGGAYMSGSARSHAAIASQIASRLGATALLVDYRLAPEHAFPAQVEDCLAVYRELLAGDRSPGSVVFAGESAGGTLAVSTQLLGLRRGVAPPAAAIVLSPWLDFECRGESYVANADADLLQSQQSTRGTALAVFGEDGLHDPLASPILGSLEGVAPMFVQPGGAEVLVDDARALVRCARRDRVECELDVVPGMQHTFQMMAGRMPEADAALDRATAFVRKFL